MKTVLVIAVMLSFIPAFCSFYWLVDKFMKRIRRKIARKMIMRRIGLIN